MKENGVQTTVPLFNSFAGKYREVINKSIRWSGEKYEYFIGLRVRMMSEKLVKYFWTDYLPWTVLDFGCGIGSTAPFLRRAMPVADLFGIDISDESIRAAQERPTGEMKFMVYDGKTLPYPDEAFQVIYMNGVMHHIPVGERHDVFCELWRVTAPGGLMFIFENNPWNPLMAQAMRKNPFDDGTKAIKLSDLSMLASNAGFKVMESWYYCLFPRFLNFMRSLEPKLGRFPLGAQYCLWVIK